MHSFLQEYSYLLERYAKSAYIFEHSTEVWKQTLETKIGKWTQPLQEGILRLISAGIKEIENCWTEMSQELSERGLQLDINLSTGTTHLEPINGLTRKTQSGQPSRPFTFVLHHLLLTPWTTQQKLCCQPSALCLTYVVLQNESEFTSMMVSPLVDYQHRVTVGFSLHLCCIALLYIIISPSFSWLAPFLYLDSLFQLSLSQISSSFLAYFICFNQKFP